MEGSWLLESFIRAVFSRNYDHSVTRWFRWKIQTTDGHSPHRMPAGTARACHQ